MMARKASVLPLSIALLFASLVVASAQEASCPPAGCGVSMVADWRVPAG